MKRLHVCAHLLVLTELAHLTPHVEAAELKRFDVVSIRPAAGARGFSSVNSLPSGLWIGVGVSVASLVANAFAVPSAQIVNGPDWIRQDIYDIQAKVEPPDSDRKGRIENTRQRLQAMLVDRFHLVFKVEKRETRGLELVVVNKQPTSRFSKSASDEAPSTSAVEGKIQYTAASMAQLARNLSAKTGLVIADETDLDGRFSFALEIGMATSEVGEIDNALRPLGLGLKSKKILKDFVLIESVERPTAN